MQLFMTATRPPQSWERDGDVFFGPYCDYKNPRALEYAPLGRHPFSGGQAVGAMEWSFELPGKNEYELASILGVMTAQRVRECSWSAIQSRESVEQCFEYSWSRVR